eukprot:11261735-Ditylum_brightwellii.AAC.1
MGSQRIAELAERWRIGKKGIMSHSVHSTDQDVERFYQIESMQIGGETKTERFFPICLLLIQGKWHIIWKDSTMIMKMDIL